MRLDGQMTLGDVNPDYQAFVDKFKPKKTTDDCYTPACVYDAILGWVVQEYGIDPEKIIRPFWPGGDYQNESYPEGWTVVDNPPFSILSRICKDYQAAGVRFFLFSPYLTNFSCGRGVTHIITASSITYENGAVVDTAFLTNLDERFEIRGCPELGAIIEAADREEQKTKKAPQLPRYSYPDEVITPATIGYLAKHGVRIDIPFDECYFIRTLDAQRAAGKTIFGGGIFTIRAESKRASGSGASGSGASGSGASGSGASGSGASGSGASGSDQMAAITTGAENRGRAEQEVTDGNAMDIRGQGAPGGEAGRRSTDDHERQKGMALSAPRRQKGRG